ncbi:MAG: M23 family metallopeptidase [Muribaculaceae bacterium]|nr:M23 family metallopeptidase [Muribaculaceae bacterium]
MADKKKEKVVVTKVKVGDVRVKMDTAGHLKVRPRRYRLTLQNESSMRPRISFTASRGVMIIGSIVGALVLAVIGALLLGTTPLRSVLPGYLKRGQRSELYVMSEKIDSLNQESAVNRAYIDNIAAVFSADVDLDSVRRATEEALAATTLPLDSLLATSQEELDFVRHYEQRERFNASILSPIAAEGMIFYAPVSASPLMESVDATGRVTLQLPASSPVSAMYRGTVVDAYYTPSQGYTVVVQHPNEFITRYSGMATKLVDRGQKVKTGERIGLTTPSSTEDSKRLPVTLEMWHNGTQLNPKQYVTF